MALNDQQNATHVLNMYWNVPDCPWHVYLQHVKPCIQLFAWGQSRSLFHVGGSEEYTIPTTLHRSGGWAGGQSSHVHSCVRGVMRGANGVREGGRERELRAQLPILNHYEEAEEGRKRERGNACLML